MTEYKIIFIDGSQLHLTADSYTDWGTGTDREYRFTVEKGTIAKVNAQQVRAVVQVKHVISVG